MSFKQNYLRKQQELYDLQIEVREMRKNALMRKKRLSWRKLLLLNTRHAISVLCVVKI